MRSIAITFLFSLLISFSSLNAQNDLLIGFKGKVYCGDDKGEKVLVSLYDGNKKVSSYKTSGNGKFIMDLSRNRNYTVEFDKPGYVTKRVSIDTRIVNPMHYPKKTFKFDVSLIEEKEGVDYSTLDFPMALIEFEAEEMAFDYNLEYTMKRMEEQNLLQSKGENVAHDPALALN